MSFRLIPLMWEHAQVSGSAKLVLMAMINFADDQGERIFPSYRTIANMTGLSRSYVRKLVRRLQEDGYIEMVKRGGFRQGRNFANEYRLSPHWLTTASRPAAANELAHTGVTVAGARHDPVQAGGTASEKGVSPTEHPGRPHAAAPLPTEEHPGCHSRSGGGGAEGHPVCTHGDGGYVHPQTPGVPPEAPAVCPGEDPKPISRSFIRSREGKQPSNATATGAIHADVPDAYHADPATFAAAAADAGSPPSLLIDNSGIDFRADVVAPRVMNSLASRPDAPPGAGDHWATPAEAAEPDHLAPPNLETDRPANIAVLYHHYVGAPLRLGDRARLAELAQMAPADRLYYAFDALHTRLQAGFFIRDPIAYLKGIVVRQMRLQEREQWAENEQLAEEEPPADRLLTPESWRQALATSIPGPD